MVLLLTILGSVIGFSLHQSQLVGNASHQLAEAGLKEVTLARTAQTQALLAAGYLHSLFLLDHQADRVPIYTAMDACTAARNAAMNALLTQTRDPEATPLVERVEITRKRFSEVFQSTVEAVEIDIDGARPLMVQGTLPALREMLSALENLAAFETNHANRQLAQIDEMQTASRRHMLLLGAAAVLLALLSAVVITRSIAKPLAAAARVANDIANGQMDTALPRAGRDEVGQLVRALETMRCNLADRESRIVNLAFRDTLTGLANRTLFQERLGQAIASANRANHPLSLLILDLDRFKEVNDVLGHHVGDQVLVEVAGRLRPVLTRISDTLARLGGDEFGVLLPTQSGDDAQLLAQKLLESLETPLVLDGQSVDISGSIGIATFPEDGLYGAELMARADTAMYVSKQERTGYARFTKPMECSADRGLGLLGDLRRAIVDNEFRLMFQPKVAARSGECRAAEALIRWRHPIRGDVSPMDFIPFAERTGFIRSITSWVLNQAIETLADWRKRGIIVSLSVNVSTRDLVHPDLVPLVRERLQCTQVPAGQLCLEVTEGAIMEDPARGLHTLQALNAMGVTLSIDDFGTGYSSMAYLKNLPMHELKIDRSFVHNMNEDPDNAAIVRATIDLAHTLGMTVVAEGVETEEVRQLLAALGCEAIQGYLISRPLSADQFLAWIDGRQNLVRVEGRMSA